MVAKQLRQGPVVKNGRACLNVYGNRMQRLAGALVCAGMMAALSGCRHRRPQLPVLPAVLAPIPLATLPPPTSEPMLQAPPPQPQMPIPIAAAAASPRRERRRTTPRATTTPEESSPEPVPEADAIGELTTGGATNPQAQQEAAEMISTIGNRLKAIPAQTARHQRTQINKIRNFWHQAQGALNSGDVEGAKTLATKAKLLLDDLEKQGGGE